MKSNKIVFIVPNLSTGGGINRVIIDRANQLSNDDYNVKIISLIQKKNIPKWNINEKIEVEYLPIYSINMKMDFIKIAKFIKKIHIEKNSIVIINEVGNILASYLALKNRKDLKLIAWDHTSFYNGKKFGLAWWGRYIAVKKMCHTIAITKDSKNQYNRVFKKNNVIQIYNPIVRKKDTVKYNLSSKKIISCGYLDNSIKGFDMLVNVAKKVFEKHVDWTWDIFGAGSDKDIIQQQISNLKLDNHVFLKGYEKDIINKYNEYSMFILTSRKEGLGLVIGEAQINKLPVIAFNCHSGPDEFINNGENGFLIKCYDIDEMAEKICTLIENRQLREKFSGNSTMWHYKFEIKEINRLWKQLL